MDNNNPGGGGNGGGTGFAAAVQPIFSANCALSGCHAGSSPAQGMNLSQGQAYANIVNVSSYLVHKIQGTQSNVGGSGGQMPLGRNPLSQAQIDTIRQWIADGAPNN
jgi:mono/diheme cytochrome c family protein